MRFKLTKFNLRVTSIASLMIAVAVLLLSVFSPVRPPISPTEVTIQLPATTPASTQVATNLDLFSDLMDVDLRKPLVDAPLKTGSSTPGDSTLGLRLVGTIIEPTHRYAIFTDAIGKSEIKSVGDKAGGADVTDITPDSVSLRLPGRSMVLHPVKPAVIGGLGL